MTKIQVLNTCAPKYDASLDQGITSFDQADIYGGYEAEEILGNALSGSTLRNKMEIVTKCDIIAPVGRYANARVKYYDTSRAHIMASVDHSLRLMGIDHIDLKTAKNRDIIVTNTPGLLAEDTADLVLTLMLALPRRIYEGSKIVVQGKWNGWSPTHMLGSRIHGKRLGIIGMGRIGQAIAKRD